MTEREPVIAALEHRAESSRSLEYSGRGAAHAPYHVLDVTHLARVVGYSRTLNVARLFSRLRERGCCCQGSGKGFAKPSMNVLAHHPVRASRRNSVAYCSLKLRTSMLRTPSECYAWSNIVQSLQAVIGVPLSRFTLSRRFLCSRSL